MSIFRLILFIPFALFLFVPKVQAESGYVLPYPSSMPGSFLYNLEIVKEEVEKYFYFGDFGQFKYNLKLADKYLVEASVLFNYDQYLLGVKALEKSNSYYKKILPSLVKAKKNSKNTTELANLYEQGRIKHIEELNMLKNILPETFLWTEENRNPTNLELHKLIESSIKVRND